MFFHRTRQGACGTENYIGHEIVGWKVVFRRGGADRPMQYRTFHIGSKFGVLRTIIQDGRDWHGKIFYLAIESIKPIVKAVYVLAN